MKMYLTKYATTGGCIQLITGQISPDDPGYFRSNNHGWISLRIGRDVFHTEEEARKAVTAQINKRIASLQKQIEKLNKIEITVKE